MGDIINHVDSDYITVSLLKLILISFSESNNILITEDDGLYIRLWDDALLSYIFVYININ